MKDQIKIEFSPASTFTANVKQDRFEETRAGQGSVRGGLLSDETLPAALATPAPGQRSDETDRDAYSIYLREIGAHQLLTPAEEIDLAVRLRQGNAAAREKMITSNLRLVVKIARAYDGFGLPLLDLISEGNIGLMKAVDRFNPIHGVKFSVYAGYWIKQSIRRALANQGRTIRLPVHVVDKLCRLRKASALLEEVLGRDPSDEELAQELDLPTPKVARLRAATLRTASLDALLPNHETETLASLVPDETAADPLRQLIALHQVESLNQAMRPLSEREQLVLRCRFDLNHQGEQTLHEVAQVIGVTRERVRQIQSDAIKKLRASLQKLETTGGASRNGFVPFCADGTTKTPFSPAHSRSPGGPTAPKISRAPESQARNRTNRLLHRGQPRQLA